MRTKLLMSALLICIFSAAFSQGDTTKIKMKNKKIIIINEKDGQKDASLEFKKNIIDLQDSISRLRRQIDTLASNKEKSADLDRNISDLEKQLDAYKKGLEDLTGEKDDDGKIDIKIEDEANNDGDEHKEHKNGIKNKKLNKFRGHWNGISLMFNSLVSKNGSFTLPNGSDGGVDASFLDVNVAKSYSYSFDLIQGSIPIIGKRFGLITGLGAQLQSYEIRNNYTLSENTSGQTVGHLDAVDYNKNELDIWQLQVPMILELNSASGYFVNCGVLGGLRIGSHQEQKYNANDKEYDLTVRSDFNLSPFTATAVASIGYKHIAIFGQYQLTSMFKSGKGPDVYPLAIGAKFVF